MRPLVAVLPYAPVFWTAWVWAFLPEWRIIRRARASGAAVAPQDAGSLRLIVVGINVALCAAFALAFLVPGAAIVRHRAGVFWAGVALLVAGSLLRRHCFRVLGAWFSGAVSVRADQPVVEGGAYRWVRHPSYTAAMLMFAGVGLALGNWVSLGVLTVAPIPIYLYRSSVEERALVATLGEPYRAYIRRTKRFVPYVV